MSPSGNLPTPDRRHRSNSHSETGLTGFTGLTTAPWESYLNCSVAACCDRELQVCPPPSANKKAPPPLSFRSEPKAIEKSPTFRRQRTPTLCECNVGILRGGSRGSTTELPHAEEIEVTVSNVIGPHHLLSPPRWCVIRVGGVSASAAHQSRGISLERVTKIARFPEGRQVCVYITAAFFGESLAREHCAGFTR